MSVENPVLNGIGIAITVIFFGLTIVRFKIMMSVLEHLKNNYGYFYQHLTHGTNNTIGIITSGKSITIGLKLLYSKTYDLDETIIRKIGMFKIVTIIRWFFFIAIIYILYKIRLIVIPGSI